MLYYPLSVFKKLQCSIQKHIGSLAYLNCLSLLICKVKVILHSCNKDWKSDTTFSTCITGAFQGIYEGKSRGPSFPPLFPAENPIVVSQEIGVEGRSGGWRLGMMTEPASEERNEVTLSPPLLSLASSLSPLTPPEYAVQGSHSTRFSTSDALRDGASEAQLGCRE